LPGSPKSRQNPERCQRFAPPDYLRFGSGTKLG
jgi:hypothetical protein